jgi:signal transduction histidine kinase
VTTAERPPRPRAPISLQLVALLLASLLTAQAISFGIIMFMPPPRPDIYRTGDVVIALRGGALNGRFSRPLTRVASPVLPPDLTVPHAAPERSERALAMALGVPETRVRLVEHSPSLLWRLRNKIRRRERAADPNGLAMAAPPFAGDRYGPAEQPPPESSPYRAAPGGRPRPWRHYGLGPDMPIFGDFAAAVQQDDGQWLVVRSTPEPFPTDWQLRTSMWLLLGFLLVAPAGYLFSRRITAPLKRFAEAAEIFGRDPQAPQMTLTGPAEIGAAAHAFNEMQARLKRYVLDRTAMVGAISHDLRTPLSRIRFKMESAPPALKESVLSDVAQMEQMIGGVLAFIRNEGAPRRREKLDLLSLIECVADDAAMVGGDVELLDGPSVAVEGDAIALQRMFANLVDNAVTYGHSARIQLRQENNAAIVEIADRGEGLSPDELQRVFQPFYRSDSSRNLDNAGVGLGLPIARSTARAHGGDVELTSGSKGVTAVVTLPAAS